MRSGHDGAMTTAPLYTLAQYAIALGITARAARKSFGRRLRAAGDKKPINGRLVCACPLSALPPLIRQRIALKAAQARCRDADDWLTHCLAPWQPKLPLREWPACCLERAARRREALAPVLRAGARTASVSRLVGSAQAALARMGADRRPAERSVRRWIERALRRDRGRGEWERLELYLEEGSTRRRTSQPRRPASFLQQGILREALELLDQARAASLEDKGRLWLAAMEEMDRRVERGQSERAARAGALEALAQSGAPLARNREALRKSLARKRRRWRQSDGGSDALQDRRPGASGNFRQPELAQADKHRLLARSLGCGGRLAQAYRELWDEGRLPAAFCQSYTRDACDKSRVPKAVRALFPAEFLAELQKQRLGKKAVALRGPKCARDWSAMPAGVQAQSDDCTLPVYFWVPSEDGSCKLLRGQFLPWIDTRTTYIHCFQLLPTESYSSLDIVRGVVRLHDEFGLPPELYFERGIWQRSLLISGRGDEVPWKGGD
jgi:hypothetical protein